MSSTQQFLDALKEELKQELKQELTGKIIAGPALTVGQFAEETGLSQSSVYREIKEGGVAPVKGISRLLIPRSELRRFL